MHWCKPSSNKKRLKVSLYWCDLQRYQNETILRAGLRRKLYTVDFRCYPTARAGAIIKKYVGIKGRYSIAVGIQLTDPWEHKNSIKILIAYEN